MYRAGELSKMFTSSSQGVYYGAFKRPTATSPFTLSIIAHSLKVMCDRQNDDTLKMSMSYSSVFMSVSPNMAKGTVQL